MKQLLILFTVFAGLFILSSCSTVLNSTTQEILLKSQPPNANILVDGKKFGTSPQFVNIDRGSNHVVKFQLDGYDVYETQITRKISFWFWGNALNAFIPGMLIDGFTGSMYTLLPDQIDVELTPAKIEDPVKKK